MAVYVVKKALAFVKANPATFADTDAIRVEEVEFSFPTAETNRRPSGGTAMGSNATFVGGVEGAITLKFPLKGSGAAGTAPDFDAALQACHMTHVNSAGVSDTYTPSNGGVTLYDCMVEVTDQDGGNPYVVRIDSAVGNLKLEGKRNGPMFAMVEMKGVFVIPTNPSALGASALDTTVAQNFKGTSVDLHGETTLAIEGYEFDLGNEIVMRPSLADAQGFISALVLSRAPSGKIDPEIPAIATEDLMTKLTAETQGVLNFGAIGGTAGNIVTITHPLSQLAGASLAERNGILTGDLELHFHETLSATGADADDISIVFT